MASIPGGPADKLGNEFERLWTIRHLIEVIAGRATSVVVESLGDDEKGTEFWVSRPDGTREAHQCKRENGSSGDWSAADLNAKRVLANAKAQLDRDARHRFVFVSGDKAPQLSDLTERARRGDADVVFRDEAIKTPSLKSEFANLCRYLGLDPKSNSELAVVRDFLMRFSVRVIDKSMLRFDVEDLAARWISGDSATVVTGFESFISRNESMGRVLADVEILKALPAGCHARDLGKDATLPHQVEELRLRFNRSYEHLLVDGKALNRGETDRLLDLLKASDGPRLILIHGVGGVGKSGVVYEAVSRLTDQGILVLPLRLDRDKPADSPHRYGESLDLPASPAASLAAVSHGHSGVLVLDQIDAIRWTSAHSAHAWDTCERVINEALRYPNLRVVVVCRSFDVDDDARIKDWKQRRKAEELKVELLDPDAVKTVVNATGGRFEELDERQRQVLRSPQALYLWRRLHNTSEGPSKFRNTTDLMKSFWTLVRRKLTALKPGRYEEALYALVSYMDLKGTLFAPPSVVDQWGEECAALISLNVLTEGSGGKLTFGHQSYLDYLTAQHVLGQIRSRNMTLFQWLKENDQSLFRRGQLRQLLTLLREEDAQQYADTLLDLVTASGVRFHLQHLAMQMLGHSEEPTDAEAELVIGLIEDPKWRPHVFTQVLAERSPWFDKLQKIGVLAKWLDGDQTHQQMALGVMQRVVTARGPQIETLLKSPIGSGWHPGVDSILSLVTAVELSDGLFSRYLEMAESGSDVCRFIDWKKSAEMNALRAIRLLAARMKCYTSKHAGLAEDTDAQADQREITGRDGIRALSEAAAAQPIEAWHQLMPRLIEVSKALQRIKRRRGRSYSYRYFNSQNRLRRQRQTLRQLLTIAGRSLAQREPEKLWSSIENLKMLPYRSVQSVMATSLAKGPAEWSDKAIRWLLEDPQRLACGFARPGRRYRATLYLPAMRLIKHYGASCSERAIRELERAILKYRSEEEIEDYRLCHDYMMSGALDKSTHGFRLYERGLFLGRYLLLSAIPRTRLLPETADQIGVLRRKFGPVRRLLRESPHGTGGFVTSTIPNEKLHLVSDRQWLDIVSRDWSSKAHRWRQLKKNVVGEVKPETFATDLATMARRQPARFAALAMAMPIGVKPIYVEAILRSLGETKPPDKEDTHQWRPASVEQIEAIIGRFEYLLSDRDIATALCRAVRSRSEENWSDETLTRIAVIAKAHVHPAPGKYTVFASRRAGGGSEEMAPDARATAINSVRGVAAEAIEALLYGHLDRRQILDAAIESLVQDPHPAVRISAIGISIPLINGNREAAVDLFLHACDHPDDVVLTAPDLGRFLSYMLLDYHVKLRPLIERMMSSEVESVAKAAAGWVASLWAHTGKFKDLLDQCLLGRASLRHGVAEVLSREVSRYRGGKEAVHILSTLFDDPEKDVRGAAALVFRYDEVYAGGAGSELAQALIDSAAFSENTDDVLYGLKDVTVSLVPYASVLSAIVRRVKESEESGNIASRFHVHTGLFAELLLRLYEQSEGDSRRRRECLDAWDDLLASGASYGVLERLDS